MFRYGNDCAWNWEQTRIDRQCPYLLWAFVPWRFSITISFWIDDLLVRYVESRATQKDAPGIGGGEPAELASLDAPAFTTNYGWNEECVENHENNLMPVPSFPSSRSFFILSVTLGSFHPKPKVRNKVRVSCVYVLLCNAT